MPRWSEFHRLPDGSTAIVCFSGKRPKAPDCAGCGERSTLQCDYLVASDKTCDAYLCRRCAVHQGPNRDYCPHHQPEFAP